ncbi:MAG TPA: hypothetical protein VFF39_02220 [Verrucomicrobiae bacterium]|jgi:hypothetical protein|nr:hypothetical protein [Verrucomicrobiae bacterium]
MLNPISLTHLSTGRDVGALFAPIAMIARDPRLRRDNVADIAVIGTPEPSREPDHAASGV